MIKINKLNQVGDTLVEVMLSATALALVLSVSFVSANHSLRTGTDAASRNEAVQYASEQVELLKQAINSGNATLPTVRAGNFCMDYVSHNAVSTLVTCKRGDFDIKITYVDPTYKI